MTDRICSHARPFSARCIECELILARERLASAKDDVGQYGKLVVKLEAEQKMAALAMSAANNSSMIAEIIGPDGRVHYRRPPNDPAVEEALGTPGYTVRFVEEVA